MKHTDDSKSDVSGPVKTSTPEPKAPQPQLLRRNLSDDIQGVPSQALAQASLPPVAEGSPESSSAMDRAQDPVAQAAPLHAQAPHAPQDIEATPQDPATHADIWRVQMQVRTHRLKDTIHQLSDRLNLFDK